MPMLDQQQALQFKSRLRKRAEQLRDDIQGTLARSGEESHVRISEQARDNGDDSFSDLIVDTNLSEIDRDVEELRRISAALNRINAGSFGFCVDCDRAIPLRRLDAEPTAARCVQCQELYEKTHAGVSTPRL